MSANLFGIVELLGVFAVLLGVLGWQLVSIRRTLRQDAEKAERERAAATEGSERSSARNLQQL